MDAERSVRRAVRRLVADEGQSAVALAAGVSQPTISRFLSGEHGLTFRLSRGLGRAYPELRERLRRAAVAEDADDVEEVVAG